MSSPSSSKKTRETATPALAAATSPQSPRGAVGAVEWGGDWLAAISAAAGAKKGLAAKAPAPRKLKGPPTKSPDELIVALAMGNLKKLKEALAGGVDPNFMVEHGERGDEDFYVSTPLGMALFNRWMPAAEALAAHGADEGLARKRYVEQGDRKLRAQREREVAERDGVNWESFESAEPLAFVLRTQKDPELIKKAARSAIGCWACAEWLVDHRQDHLLDDAQWLLAEKKAWLRIASRKLKGVEACQRLFDKIWRARPALLERDREFRWGMAIMSNNPKFTHLLIEKGAPSPANAMAVMTEECFPGMHNDCVPPELVVDRDSVDLDEESVGFSANDPVLSVPLWIAAICAEAPASLKMLGQIDGLAQAALARPDTARSASFCSDLATMREAKRQGLPLASCVDEQGRTPAHHAFRLNLSPATMKAWAALCPEWMSARAPGFGTPLDVAKKERSRSGGAELEQAIAQIEAIVLKVGVKDASERSSARGPRAAKTAAKRTPSRRL
jgi:hypothetical protein